MKWALISAVGLISGCGTVFTCKPGTCPTGEHCVYVGSETTPSCRPACDVGDAGTTCTSGTTCRCGGTCAGCENCIGVCAAP